MSLPNCKKPCSDCPFRKDTLKGWLGEGRVTDILGRPSFVCHKKTHLQCAGHMLLKGSDNEFVRFASRMRLETGLHGAELVFDSEQECIEHHATGN